MARKRILMKSRLVRAVRETLKFQNWSFLTNSRRRYMAKILPIRRKKLSNQSFKLSKITIEIHVQLQYLTLFHRVCWRSHALYIHCSGNQFKKYNDNCKNLKQIRLFLDLLLRIRFVTRLNSKRFPVISYLKIWIYMEKNSRTCIGNKILKISTMENYISNTSNKIVYVIFTLKLTFIKKYITSNSLFPHDFKMFD